MEFATRRATESDVDAIAEAHLDSIRSIGARYYPRDVVDDWCEGIGGSLYLRAMRRGEVFFIAIGEVDGRMGVLGFASDYPIAGSERGASAYVRGAVARRGVASALLRLAEAHAIAHGAQRVKIDASLAGVEFYAAHGFVEIGRQDVRLRTGRTIACVIMEKELLQGDA
jgi:putative acetyltransferase